MHGIYCENSFNGMWQMTGQECWVYSDTEVIELVKERLTVQHILESEVEECKINFFWGGVGIEGYIGSWKKSSGLKREEKV